LVTHTETLNFKKPDFERPVTQTHLQTDLDLVSNGIKCSVRQVEMYLIAEKGVHHAPVEINRLPMDSSFIEWLQEFNTDLGNCDVIRFALVGRVTGIKKTVEQ